MSKRNLVGWVLVASILMLSTMNGNAQETAPPKSQRAYFALRHANVKEVANALAKHFKGEAELEPVTGIEGGVLLVRGNAATLDEMKKLVAILDRVPRLVSVELTLVELAAKAGESAKDLEEKAFAGSAKEVEERLETLKKNGRLVGMKRFQFSTAEGTPTTLMTGGARSFVTGMSGGFGGRAAKGGIIESTRSISYRDVGTQVKVTARVPDGKTVQLEIDLSDSSARTPEDGVAIGKDENGAPVRAPEFINNMLKSKLSITPGKTVLVKDAQTTTKSGQNRMLIFATASVTSMSSVDK